MLVWNITEECDEEYKIELRRIGGGQGAQTYFDPFEKQHVKISINQFKSIQSTGYPISDFTIKIEGYYPRSHVPDIQLK